MANGFVVNAHRFDPYKNFKFHVFLEGRLVMGVSKVGALKRTTEVVSYRSGGDNSIDFKSPGRTKYDAVTLERGRTHDPEFERWAASVHTFGSDAATDLRNYKKSLTIEMLNLRNQPAIRYFLYNCWPSSYTAQADLSAGENGVMVESLELQVEGWERDFDLAEPDESA
jgi:phage tail-like protein